MGFKLLCIDLCTVDDIRRDDLVGDELLEEESPGDVLVAGGHAVHRGVVRVRDRQVVLQRPMINGYIVKVVQAREYWLIGSCMKFIPALA